RKITLVNLPDSLGSAGRIVNVMLKSRIYHEAKKRHAADPNIRDKQQLALIMDEFQNLVTFDLSGESDATFPNLCRTTGCFYIVATQGIQALKQAIGDYTTENFLDNMRGATILLSSEEPATLDYGKKLAGKTLRSFTYSTHDHESY